mgnify:FL=1
MALAMSRMLDGVAALPREVHTSNENGVTSNRNDQVNDFK